MANIALALIGADDDAFTVNAETIVVQVVGVLPGPIALREPERRLGFRRINKATWSTEIRVAVYPASVQASDWDFGDVAKLNRVLRKEHLKILRTGTVLYRTMTTGGVDHLYWTDVTNGLLKNDLKVARTRGPEISPDYETGTDKVTFVLEPEVPTVL